MSIEGPLSHEAESLSRVSLFKRLEPGELETLAAEVDQVNFKAGEKHQQQLSQVCKEVCDRCLLPKKTEPMRSNENSAEQ